MEAWNFRVRSDIRKQFWMKFKYFHKSSEINILQYVISHKAGH